MAARYRFSSSSPCWGRTVEQLTSKNQPNVGCTFQSVAVLQPPGRAGLDRPDVDPTLYQMQKWAHISKRMVPRGRDGTGWCLIDAHPSCMGITLPTTLAQTITKLLSFA